MDYKSFGINLGESGKYRGPSPGWTRKVQKVGKSTLSISLPKEWTEKRNVDKGNSLFIKEIGDSLKVKPTKPEEKKKEKEALIQLDSIKDPVVLKKLLLALYSEGRGEIKLVSDERIQEDLLQIIRTAQQEFIGLSILKESEREITLKILTDPKRRDLHFSNLIDRIKTLIETMHKEIEKALAGNKKALAQSVLNRSMEGKRMKNLLIQTIESRINEGSVKELMDKRLVAKFISLILTYESKIAERVVKALEIGEIDSVRDGIIGLSEDVLELYLTSIESFTKERPELFKKVLNIKEKIEEQEENLLSSLPKKLSSELIPILRFILWGYRRIAEHSSSIASVAISRAVRSPEMYGFSSLEESTGD